MSSLDLRDVERLVTKLRMAFEDQESALARVAAVSAELEPLVGPMVVAALAEIAMDGPEPCDDCGVAFRQCELTAGYCPECVRKQRREELEQ